MDVDLDGDCNGGDQQQPSSDGGQPPQDLTADLLQKFSCMNTTDKDVLIEQLKRLLGEHITDESAVFWLDMNNWLVVATLGQHMLFSTFTLFLFLYAYDCLISSLV